jgi:hypothetical protein
MLPEVMLQMHFQAFYLLNMQDCLAILEGKYAVLVYSREGSIFKRDLLTLEILLFLI